VGLRSRLAVAVLAVAAHMVPVPAAEPPVQPLVLPMADLLARLDPATPWQFLPLADWQRLRALAATRAAPAAWTPDGAWTGGVAHLHIQDGWVHGRAEMTAVARGDRLPIQFALGDEPSYLAIDGRPALVDADAQEHGIVWITGLTPGPCRVTWTWATRISDPAEVAVPMPAGLTAVRITAQEPLQIAGERVVADGDGWRWLPDGTVATLRLRAGSREGGPAVWGIRQDLALTWQDSEGLGTWNLIPVAYRGQVPDEVEVRLPAGWTVLPTVEAPVAGVAPGVVRLRPGLWRVQVDPRGALAAPQIAGAVHQGLRAVVRGARVEPGPGWTADGDGWRIPAGSPGRIRAGEPVQPARWQAQASVDPDTWIAQERIVLRPGVPLARLVLTPPAGWRIRNLEMPGWQPDQDLDLSRPGAPVTVTTAAPLTGPLTVGVILAAEDVGDAVAWHPLRIDGAVAEPTPVTVRWGDDLDVGAVAGPGWRVVQAEPLDLMAVEPGRPLHLRRAVRPLHGQAEAVVYVLPAASLGQEGGDWARLDLRLMVHAGRPARLHIDGLAWDEVRPPAGWAATRAAERLELTPPQPWRGERLLRIEGRLRAGVTALPPAVRLVDAAGQGVPAAPPFLVLQSGGLAEVAPVAGDGARSEDDLPAWSRPMPGAPVVAVERSGPARSPWRWSTVRRSLATMPAGVVADAHARVQVSPDRVRLWWRASVAAPGADALPVILPAGAELRAATCDGRPAVIRAGTPPRLVLPSARTTLCLLVDLPAPGGALALRAPDLGLAVTGTRWQVAVEGGLLARPWAAPDAVALVGLQEPWPAGPLGIGGAVERLDAMPRPAEPAADHDPRRLRPAAVPPPVDQEPMLDLQGVLAQGQGGGAPVLRLTLVEREAVRTAQRFGWVLALVIGVILGWSWRARAALLVGLGAILAALALRLLGDPWGPLLPALDLLPFALLLGILLARIRRWNDPSCAP
jgi:hypothetical protein